MPRYEDRRRPPPRPDPRPFAHNPLISPVGPPPRRRPPTRQETRFENQVEHTLQRAARTGVALTPVQSRRAVGKYGFLAANAIEMGLRDIERQREMRAMAAYNTPDHNAVFQRRKQSLAEKVSGFGMLPNSSALGRAVNLVTSIPKDAAVIGIGLGQLAGRTAYNTALDTAGALTGGDTSRTGRQYEQLLKETFQSYKQRYGAGFKTEIGTHPLGYILDAWMGAGAATRVGSVSAHSLEAIKSGVSPLKAIQQGYWKSVNPLDPRLSVPGEARTLPLRERDIPFTWSRSPMGRYFQRLHDNASLVSPEKGRLGRMFHPINPDEPFIRSRLPVRGTDTRAGLRATKLARQQNARGRAGLARSVAYVNHPGGRITTHSGRAAIRLFWESNLPAEWRGAGNEGLQRLHQHFTELQNAPARVRQLAPTAKLLEARARYERLQSLSEKAVGENKTKIAKQLDKAGADMRAAENSYAVISRRNADVKTEGGPVRAEQQLAKVQATIDSLIAGIEKDMKAAMGGKFDPAETMRRTKAKLEEMSRQPDETGRRLSALLDEHAHLQDLVEAKDPFAPVEKPPPTPTATEDIPSNLGRGKYQGAAARYGGAASVAADELAALEKRHLSRIGQSRDQLAQNLDGLNQRIARSKRGTQTRQALETRAARLQQLIDTADQVSAANGYLTTVQLEKRISELEQAMAHAPDTAYRQALVGAVALTADLEKISQRALAGHPDSPGYGEALQTVRQIHENRRSLLTRSMGHEAPPSDIFAPHEAELAKLAKFGLGGARKGSKVREPSTSWTNMQKNELRRVETGSVSPDLRHLITRWGKAQAWKFNTDIVDILWDAGEDIPVNTVPRKGWTVVDRSGKANPELWRNAELGSDEALNQGLRDFVEQSIWKEGDKPVATYQGLRQVAPHIRDAVFHESGVDIQSGKLSQSFDMVNGLVRTSLLYANPGYYPANFAGNLIFLGLHQHGFALPNLFRSGQMYLKNRELHDLVSAEVGMGPTESVAARGGTGRLGTALEFERRFTNVAASIPDNWPRAAAWIFEARKLGYKDDASMLEMFRSIDERTVQIRQGISDRAQEAMVNFDRISPLERATLGRVFFVWPWIRGATAWPGHYMREFPERAGVIGPAATQENRNDTAPFMGGLPAYLEGLIPLNKAGTRVLNLGSVSPTQSAAQLVQTFTGTVNAIAHNQPPPKYQGIGDMINPLIDFAWNTIHGETSFGQKVGYGSALKENTLGLVPLAGTVLQATGHQPISPTYADKSGRGVLERRWGRVFPFDINTKAIAERAKQDTPGTSSTPETRAADWVKETTKLLGPPNEAIRRARRNQMLAEQAAIDYKKKVYGSSRHSLSERENAAILLAVDVSQFPGRWDPAVAARRQNDIRNGPPLFVTDFIRDERNRLYNELLSQVNQQMSDKKKQLEAKAYAATHSG